MQCSSRFLFFEAQCCFMQSLANSYTTVVKPRTNAKDTSHLLLLRIYNCIQATKPKEKNKYYLKVFEFIFMYSNNTNKLSSSITLFQCLPSYYKSHKNSQCLNISYLRIKNGKLSRNDYKLFIQTTFHNS